jgi:transcriptional antiterminator Rof (Rho-off)
MFSEGKETNRRNITHFRTGHDVPIDEAIDCTVNRLHYRLKDATLWQLLARLLREKKNNEQLETETSKERSWRLTVHWWKHALFHPQIQRVELKNTGTEYDFKILMPKLGNVWKLSSLNVI